MTLVTKIIISLLIVFVLGLLVFSDEVKQIYNEPQNIETSNHDHPIDSAFDTVFKK